MEAAVSHASSTESLNTTESVNTPHIFTELLELVKYDDGYQEWKEKARWIKYEEEVEEAGNRWNKPHVSTPSLRGWLSLRSYLKTGLILIDIEAKDFPQLCDIVAKELVYQEKVDSNTAQKLKDLWQKKHRHQFEGPRKIEGTLKRVIKDLIVQKLESKQKPGSRPLSRATSISLHEEVIISPNNGKNPIIVDEGKVNVALQKKIPADAEAAIILEGVVSFLTQPVCVFVRLAKPVVLVDLPEVDVPTRFVFFVAEDPTVNEIGSARTVGEKMKGHPDVGISMATAITDKAFAKCLFSATNKEDILDTLDIYTSGLKVLPRDFDTEANKIDPPANKKAKLEDEMTEIDEDRRMREQSGLVRTGRFCGGLIEDFKRKKPFYWSDFTNGLHPQCLSSFLFLYFACLSPIVAFGGLLGKATENRIATIESLISGLISGVLFGMFSGQPLIILGSTGPVYVFEKILYQICKDQEWDYLSLRLWIGIWVGLILILLVVMDASAAVCYITRFTEELFATLIAFIFVFNAIQNLFKINENNKFFPETDNLTCVCNKPVNDSSNNTDIFFSNLTKDDCGNNKGQLSGSDCDFYPNVFLMSVVLFAGTFAISFSLKNFRNTGYLPGNIRSLLSDFAVVIAILSMTTLSYLSGVHTPKLVVPDSFKPTWEKRNWVVIHALIFPEHVFANPWYVDVFLAPLFAILATILIFMDQQITAVIVNRKEHKLKKGGGYHLDLLILAFIIIICSVFGLPWFVAATVLSINHLQSLTKQSKCSVPGEKPQFLGIREQRVTAILISLCIGLSTLITPVLAIIPMPVLYGVFLFMGVQSLKGLQFFDRLLLLFIPRKYQPDYVFLKFVPLHRVHLFTMIQLISLIGLWLIKNHPTTSISFPVMLVVICAIRKLMECMFSRRELRVLDDLLPESQSKNRRKSAPIHSKGIFKRINSKVFDREEEEEREEMALKEERSEAERIMKMQTQALAMELEDFSNVDVKTKQKNYNIKLQELQQQKNRVSHDARFPLPKFLIFVKLEQNEIYTPINLTQRSISKLVKLLEMKFPEEIPARLVNKIYQRTKRNMLFLLDDDMIEMVQPNQVFNISIKDVEVDEKNKIDLFLSEVEEGL